MKFTTKAAGAALGLYATLATAQSLITTGSDDDIRLRWGIPEQSASSGSGNVYFQINAPDSYTWVGIGIGSGMRGADIFLMYANGSDGVTLSTREASGHVMPTYTQRDDVELLEGSGVRDGRMRANIRCGSCDNLDLEGTNSWIAAWLPGDPADETDPEAPIQIHQGKNVFDVNLSQASISSDANPFLEDEDGSSDNTSGDTGAAEESEGSSNDDTILLAHGVIMSIVFVVLYPLGAMLMPLIGKWFIHSSSQIVAFLLMWAGFALGYVYGDRHGYFGKQAHTILGTTVVALLGLQPIFGWLHHKHYTKHQGRGIISHLHIWYGRILMILGVINGGLGLQLAGTATRYVIAYSVVAAVIFVAYLGAVVFGLMKGRRHKQIKSPPSEETRQAP